MTKIRAGLFGSKIMSKIIKNVLFIFLLFSSFTLWAEDFDVNEINGIELRLGKKYSQSIIGNSINVFFTRELDDNLKLKRSLLKLISVSNSVVGNVVSNSQYGQPVEFVFAHKNADELTAKDVQVRILNKRLVRVLLTDELNVYKAPRLRKKIINILLLAKFGYLQKKRYLMYVPDWILTGLEKNQRLYYEEKVHRDKRGFIKKVKVFRNYPAMSALVHCNGVLKISEIIDYPVTNEDYAAIYEAYSEACCLLLEYLTKATSLKNEKFIKKIVYLSIRNKKPLNSAFVYRLLVKEVKLENKKGSVVVHSNSKNFFSPLKIAGLEKKEKIAKLEKLPFDEQKKYIDEWFFDKLKKQFLTYYQPYSYQEIDKVISNLCNVDVETFNAKTPITSDIILKKSTIKLEKLLYNLDKINNITIVLDNLIAEVLMLKFKTSFIYQKTIDGLLKKLQYLRIDENYKDFGAEKFSLLVTMFKKDIAKISMRARKLDEMLSSIEDERVAPWYLYYYEFYSQDFFNAVDSESKKVKKLLDEAEKELKGNDLKVKKKSLKN